MPSTETIYRLLRAFEKKVRQHERFKIQHIDPDSPDPRAEAVLTRQGIEIESLRDAILILGDDLNVQ